VFLMHTKLTKNGAKTNLVTDPGFEEQTGATPTAPWQLGGRGGIDRTNLGHSGQNNAYVRDSIGTHQLQQNVAVRPHHRYRLSAWIRTADNNSETMLGVRTLRGRTVTERGSGAHPAYLEELR
jgi:D-arabinan endo alpha-(1,5)-arabinofuranosidase